MIYLSETKKSANLSVMQCLLKEYYLRVIIIGGPGNGKSTLVQQLAQIHRAKLIGRENYEFDEPKTQRIPFRIVLKYFAQWLAKNPALDSLEAYIAEKMGELTLRSNLVTSESIQHILSCRPCLLILDGLDEVAVPELQDRILLGIKNFLSAAEVLDADLMVVATSRPKEFEKKYKSYFHSNRFLHLELIQMSNEKVNEYAKKWVLATKIKPEEEHRIFSTLEECQEDGNTSALLRSPLYVTIILLIIKNRGRPPSQKEDLFYQYWRIIFAREKSKEKGIIKSDEALLFKLHAYLGYSLHRRAAEENVQSRLPEAEFRNSIFNFLRKQDRHSSTEAINLKTETLVKDGDRLVLLTEANDLYGFDIRSFQEFFAAVYLVQNAEDTAERFKNLKSIIYSEHWHNVALFFVGRIARNYEGEARKILRLCKDIDQVKKNYYLRSGSWFALEVASDGAFSTIDADLQHDFIEYGLEVLETGLSLGQKEELKSFIEQLSQDEKRDFLRPLLESKLRGLPESCLETVLDIYAQNFGAEEPFKNKIDTLLQSQRETSIIVAFNLALSYHPEPLWMAERLQTYWDYYEKIYNKQFFTMHEYDWSAHGELQKIDYLEKVMKVWSISDYQAVALAQELFERNFYYYLYYYLHSDEEPKWELTQPKTLSEQLILLPKCFMFLAYLRLKIPRNKAELFENINHTSNNLANLRLKNIKQQPYNFIPNAIVQALELLLQRTDLLPQLQVSLWTLFWSFTEIDMNNVSTFLEKIKSIQQKLSIPKGWWYDSLAGFCPLLPLVIEKQQIGDQDAVNKLLPFLETKTQISIIREIEESIIQYRASASQTLLTSGLA
jgi:nucleoside-triphosphatase THEP1